MKFFTLKSYLFLLCAVITISSCQKELSPETTPAPVGPLPVSLPNVPVTLSVNGKVVDDNNNPVEGAFISGGSKTTVTAADGSFTLNNGNFNGPFTTVKIEKDNYFTLVKTIYSKSNETEFITARLSPKILAGKIAVGGGQVILNPGNVSVEFPANAFVTLSGAAVTDSVSIYITYIDPTAADAGERMPGNLTGVVAPSTVYILRSLGMLAVELKNAATNQTVKIAPDKKAAITVPIPAALTGEAQATIPLWYFDESNGVWVKEGEAIKSGNTYKGEVSHFSFWNLDYFGPYCDFSIRFLNAADSTPLAYSRVTLQMSGLSSVFTDYTNSNGAAYGYVPLNTVLQMKYYKADGTVALDTTIGPYTTNADLGNVYVAVGGAAPPTTSSLIAGTLLNCNGIPVTSGFVSASVNGANFQASVNSTGAFSISVNDTLIAGASITISGYDSVSNAAIPQSTITYTGAPSLNLGYLFSCANPIAEFITYNLDGADHIFIRNIDSAFCTETFVFNRTNIACRRANGSPTVEGYVAFITGPSTTGGTDTSSILTLERFTTASTPSSLHIVSFTENYTSYPLALGVPGWVTGEFTCEFTDEAGAAHTVRSRFKIWRRP